ncbi:MAG TPA: NAD-dependent epimerase/dehydratase family protein [Vicinamibacterales bacterium]|nr:NAD-dependent epimerase/dehydratase family protein [Vicinamibacterales bacterium]
MPSNDRVLVTGGAGYFGSALAELLLARGHQVRIFDISDEANAPASVEYVRGDIRNRDQVAAACRDVAVVYHCVAQVPLAKDRDLFITVNRDGTRVLLDESRSAGVRKVIHLSSSAVFGVPAHNPVTADTPPRPQEAYGRAKLEAEQVCADAVRAGLDVTIIRPRTILGHGRLGIFQILFEWARTGLNVPVIGGGANRYQFVHATDLADACIRAAERPGAATFNIGAERFGTMREVLEALVRHAGSGGRVVSLPKAPTVAAMKLTSTLRLSPLAPYHWLMYGESMYFDTTPAREQLGWSARYSNDDMMLESYDWYLTHRDEILSARSRSPHRSALNQGVLRLVGRLL